MEKFTNELLERLLNKLKKIQILKNSVTEIFETKLLFNNVNYRRNYKKNPKSLGDILKQIFGVTTKKLVGRTPKKMVKY